MFDLLLYEILGYYKTTVFHQGGPDHFNYIRIYYKEVHSTNYFCLLNNYFQRQRRELCIRDLSLYLPY